MTANEALSQNPNVYPYEYFLQDDVCRICWNRNAEYKIFSKTSHNSPIIKNELMDKIRYCLDLDFREDSHTKNICKICFNKIEEFHKFKTFCHETDLRLREIYMKHCNKAIEDEIFDIKVVKLEFPPKIIQSITNDLHNSLDTKNCNTSLQNDIISTQPNTIGFKNYIETEQLIDNEINSDTGSFTTKDIDDTVKKKILKTKHRFTKKPSPTFCFICVLELKTIEALKSHNEEFHGIEENGTKYKCFGCEKRFKNKKYRVAHELKFCKGLNNGYKCLQCGRYLPGRRMYEAHLRDHRKNVPTDLPDNIFKCRKCKESFNTKQNLTEHYDVEHPEKTKYVCETCGRVFNRADYLRKHKVTHTGAKPHQCTQCGFRTTQRTTLTMHMRLHTGERPYLCDVCPQRCVSSSNLRVHRRTHQPSNKMYECNICNKKFSYKISLEEHIASCHDRSLAFTCEHCGATYNRQRGLRRHLAAKHAKQNVTEKKLDTVQNENVA